VLAVQHAAYAIEAELIGYPDLPPLHETLAALQATAEELWLCEEGGDLVGVVGLEHEQDEMVIARLFVAPACFRRGVGSALVAHALAQAGGRRVRVGTGARNAPALALYARFGFRRLDEGSPTPSRGYVELLRQP
jgi:ribosomal protein S18 acetylase RimI-like enzyme